MSKPKSKNSKKILEDHDGTFFCTKCGQAGFKTKSQGYGHITYCKGYKSVVEVAREETLELDEAIKNVDSHQLDGPKNLSTDESTVLSPLQIKMKPIMEKAWEKYYEKVGKTGGTSPLMRPPLGPPSRVTLQAPPPGPPRNSEVVGLKQKIILLEERLIKTERIAFNHNEHVSKPSRNFGSATDLVTSKLGEVGENKWISRLLMITAALLIYNTFSDQLKKAFKK